MQSCLAIRLLLLGSDRRIHSASELPSLLQKCSRGEVPGATEGGDGVARHGGANRVVRAAQSRGAELPAACSGQGGCGALGRFGGVGRRQLGTSRAATELGAPAAGVAWLDDGCRVVTIKRRRGYCRCYSGDGTVECSVWCCSARRIGKWAGCFELTFQDGSLVLLRGSQSQSQAPGAVCPKTWVNRQRELERLGCVGTPCTAQSDSIQWFYLMPSASNIWNPGDWFGPLTRAKTTQAGERRKGLNETGAVKLEATNNEPQG